MTRPMLSARVRVREDSTPEVVRRIHDAAATAVRETAAEIAQRSARGILGHGLVDTGYLLRSAGSHPLGALASLAYVGAFYGVFHEYGTSRGLPARPFFEPGVAAATPGFLATLEALSQ